MFLFEIIKLNRVLVDKDLHNILKSILIDGLDHWLIEYRLLWIIDTLVGSLT